MSWVTGSPTLSRVNLTSVLATAAVPRAHPVSSHPHVDVPLVLVLVGLLTVVVLSATLAPHRARQPAADGPVTDLDTASWPGSLTWRQGVVRGLSVVVLLAAIVAGRLGVDDELENLAPALVIGAGWPLLVLGCLVLGRLWRWLDPWDTLARLALRRDESTPADHVLPACVLAVGWLWFLSVNPRPLDPRGVGAALAVHTVVTLAGCVALGRARWLSSAEPVGLLLSWVGLLPRRRLTRWSPPRGAGALLGVVLAGTVFGVVRRTELWSGVAALPTATLYSTAALVASCLLGAGLAALAQRLAGSPEQAAAVAQALVPVVAGVVVAVALARNRFFTSVQLLPGLVGDPLGRGWDLLGSPVDGLVTAPLGATGLVTLQLAVVAVACLVGAFAATRPLVGDERLPVIVTLAVSLVVAVTALSWH